MLGIPTEILTMGVSTLVGAWIKISAQKSADTAAFNRAAIAASAAATESHSAARADQSWGTVATRRIIVLVLMVMAFVIVLAPFFNMPTNVLVETTHGVDLWIVDLTYKVKEYVTLHGMVTPDWLPYAILNVIGFYFGASVAKR